MFRGLLAVPSPAPVALVNTGVYPTGNFPPRDQSWYMDGNTAPNVNAPVGIVDDRWVATDFTGAVSLVSVTNGRAINRFINSGTQITCYRSQSTVPVLLIPNIDAGATWRWKSRVSLRPGSQAAPTASEDYRYVGGFANNHITTTSSDFAYFQYYQSAGTVFFEARSRRASGTVQASALTLPAAGQVMTLEVVVTPSQVVFSVDGVIVASHATVPTGPVADGMFFRSVAGAGTKNLDQYFMACLVNWGADA